jgi:hypothetical protein
VVGHLVREHYACLVPAPGPIPHPRSWIRLAFIGSAQEIHDLFARSPLIFLGDLKPPFK